MNDEFRVAMTGDVLNAEGRLAFPSVDFTPLTGDPEIAFEFLPTAAAVDAAALAGHDLLILADAAVTRESLPDDGRLALVQRFGAGYNRVDVQALNERGILFCNAPACMRRPVAVAVLTLLLALSGRLLALDTLVRARPDDWLGAREPPGTGLVGRTLGVVGTGSIGAEVMRICRPLGLRFLGYDIHPNEDLMREVGVDYVPLDMLFKESDFISINCFLNAQTEGLVSRELIALMKPSAYLINTARGPIVDQDALVAALREGRIAGAGLDVLRDEPPPPDDPIFALDNVVLTAHALSITDQCYADLGREVVAAVRAVKEGRVPANVINPAVLADSRFTGKLAAFAARFGAAEEGAP